MNNYKKYNLWLGWLSFAIASIVYLMTIEPTASLWDCSEFIATSYKLEVGHPPGAPLFMMISRFFTMFAPDVSHVAAMVNAMSALASGFTILFLFWTITMLGKKIYGKTEKELSNGQGWAILGAGLIGSLAYTFTDSFWFSAVEGEVYALSSLFTAMVFWAMLKWDEKADEPYSNRWLVLIAYLMGLSIGVHLLNLLAFPAMVFIYYFRKYPKPTTKGVIWATLISVAIVFYVLYILIPKTISIGATVDRLFVNGLGMPVNSGLVVFAVALFALLFWSVYYTHKKGKVILNTFLLMTTVIMIGYSSYATVVIRAAANPPMNSNAPDNPYSLLSLLNRDQYGEHPLLFGPYYSSPSVGYKYKTVYYETEDGKYDNFKTIGGHEYADGFTFFFPRMHKSEHTELYNQWMEIKGRQKKHEYMEDRGAGPKYGYQMITVPTFGENLKFFFGYQLNYMYWRYFLWNFVGRQSDTPGDGSVVDGNWLSGIDFIDDLYLGPQKNLPAEAKDNKGYNRYYFLPFILGMIGLFFQLSRDKKGFSVVMWLFFMTGIAIIIYLNQGASEPRERDYSFAGSFYAFCIWLGFAVMAIYEWLSKAIRKSPAAAAALATLICLPVPILMAAENWDDHDRSHRYIARDLGANYLNATLPNSILISYGDNDSFPLWYNQEVEGVRTDVRIMNIMYLMQAWYIDQMKVRANDSDPVPFSIPQEKYTKNEVVLVMDHPDTTLYADIKTIVEWMATDSDVAKMPYAESKVNVIPTRRISLPVNKKNAIACGIVRPEDAHLMVDTINFELPENKYGLLRYEMMFLDLLANFNWERPLFFTNTSTLEGLGLADYMQFDGFVYRLVPIKTPYTGFINAGRIDTEYLYDNLMNKFKFGNIKDPRVYVDYTMRHSLGASMSRNGYARLAKKLVEEGDSEKAIKVLRKAEEEMPYSQLRPHIELIIEAYYIAGDTERANQLMEENMAIQKEFLSYYMAFPIDKKEQAINDMIRRYQTMATLNNMALTYKQYHLAENIQKYLNDIGLRL